MRFTAKKNLSTGQQTNLSTLQLPSPRAPDRPIGVMAFPYTKPYTCVPRSFNDVPLTEEGVAQLQLDIVMKVPHWKPVVGLLLGITLGAAVSTAVEMGTRSG